MAPWWRRHRSGPRVCVNCRGNDEVFHGLCRHCRKALLVEETPRPTPIPRPEAEEHMPEPVSTEPAHDRPWRHLGGG